MTASERPWYDYAFLLFKGVPALPVCVNCKQTYYAGHVCPALRDLSPLGGGQKP